MKAFQNIQRISAGCMRSQNFRMIQQTRFPFSVKEKTFLASDLQVNLVKNPRPKPGPDHQYLFGGITTDHMLEIDYDQHNGGWQQPKIVANEPFELDPANATLHYSIECFEGAKAYRTDDGQIIAFRMDENFKRMQ